MRDIKELDTIDRLVILFSSIICIAWISLVAAALVFILDIPKLIMLMIQNIAYNKINLLIIWFGIMVFAIVTYILYELMKIIWIRMKRIHYLLKNDILKVFVDGRAYYLPRSSAIDAMINYMESERENEKEKTSEENA